MSEQLTLNLESTDSEKKRVPVECLGMTFPNDEKRREYFLEKLREKLMDPEFRKIEGFPIGSDEDILALSDPPYYTACPNPFIEDFIKHYGKLYDPSTDNYRREPFAADVSEGKNDPIYNAHSYHTKVPHKAIMRYILHYTEPGDVVFDGFCGTGMTGVAAQLCGDKASVESLGYRVEKGNTLLDGNGNIFSELGPRRAVVSDLSPVATFIAHNYNTPVDLQSLKRAIDTFFKKTEKDLSWMYQTKHSDGRVARVNYVVWSETFSCQNCGAEVVFLEQALNQQTGEVLRSFACPECDVQISKRTMARLFETYHDSINRITAKRVKRVPLIINYSIGKKKYEKAPDKDDLDLLHKIEQSPLHGFFPKIEMPYMYITHIKDKMANFGISCFAHFFLPRPQRALAAIWEIARNWNEDRIRHALIFMVEQCNWGMSVFARYVPTHFSQVNQYLSGVFYISSQLVDVSPWYILEGKAKRLVNVFESLPTIGGVITSLNSGTSLSLPSNSIDYIFTDPPFGENLQYSELNWLIEEFLRVKPQIQTEAVINAAQRKGLFEYQQLMEKCFSENYRVLKPGRWMTVEFHNSKNAIWNAIQEAMQRAGFVVADVRILDKKHKTYKQQVQGVVKADLIISAYKPNGGLEERFRLEAGTEDGVWDFIRTHLKQLPIFVSKDGQAEVIAERQNYLLFDRMVAFHVQRGVTVPLSAAEFYAGLAQRFSERDGMYFLPEQVAEYDKKRLTVLEVLQLKLFVTDEFSAIQWLKQQLIKKPQTFQELHPQFLKEIGGWQKHEKPLELSELLEQNFLRYDGKGEVPSQIHSYLSTNFKELRNLPKDDQNLRSKAKDRWYVPDPNKASDLEKLRERALLREFEEYRKSKQKRLKVFRLEAVRAGFKKAWQERDYTTIISVARKIPENVLQEDPKLLMWYDQALTRTGEDR